MPRVSACRLRARSVSVGRPQPGLAWMLLPSLLSACDAPSPERAAPGAPAPGMSRRPELTEEPTCAGPRARRCYLDADQDGERGSEHWTCVSAGSTSACTAPGLDCDDDDPAVHHRAEEVADGEDNDCDGKVDECTEEEDPVVFRVHSVNGGTSPTGDGFYVGPDTCVADLVVHVSTAAGADLSGATFTWRSEDAQGDGEDATGTIQATACASGEGCAYRLDLDEVPLDCDNVDAGVQLETTRVVGAGSGASQVIYRHRVVVLRAYPLSYEEVLDDGLWVGFYDPVSYIDAALLQAKLEERRIWMDEPLPLGYTWQAWPPYDTSRDLSDGDNFYYLFARELVFENPTIEVTASATAATGPNDLSPRQGVLGYLTITVSADAIEAEIDNHEYECDAPDRNCSYDADDPCDGEEPVTPGESACVDDLGAHLFDVTIDRPKLTISAMLVSTEEGEAVGAWSSLSPDYLLGGNALTGRPGGAAFVVYDLDLTFNGLAQDRFEDDEDLDDEVEIDGDDLVDDAEILEDGLESLLGRLSYDLTWASDAENPEGLEPDHALLADLQRGDFSFETVGVESDLSKLFYPMLNQSFSSSLPSAVQFNLARPLDAFPASTDGHANEEDVLEYLLNAQLYYADAMSGGLLYVSTSLPYECSEGAELSLAGTRLGLYGTDRLGLMSQSALDLSSTSYQPPAGTTPYFPLGQGAGATPPVKRPPAHQDQPALGVVALTDTLVNQIGYWLTVSDLFDYPCSGQPVPVPGLDDCTYVLDAPVPPFVDYRKASVDADGDLTLPIRFPDVRGVLQCDQLGDTVAHLSADLVLHVDRVTDAELASVESLASWDNDDQVFALAIESADVEIQHLFSERESDCERSLNTDSAKLQQELHDALYAEVQGWMDELACGASGDDTFQVLPLGTTYDTLDAYCLKGGAKAWILVGQHSGGPRPGAYVLGPSGVAAGQVELGLWPSSYDPPCRDPMSQDEACGSHQCGTAWDGCANVSCGTCASGQVCQSGLCVKAECVYSCDGCNCGTVLDSCGVEHECGTCTGKTICEDDCHCVYDADL